MQRSTYEKFRPILSLHQNFSTTAPQRPPAQRMNFSSRGQRWLLVIQKSDFEIRPKDNSEVQHFTLWWRWLPVIRMSDFEIRSQDNSEVQHFTLWRRRLPMIRKSDFEIRSRDNSEVQRFTLSA